MGWAVGYDDTWQRDIGWGVPALCDHPDCNEEINRGLGCVCGGEPYGGDDGCGLFFCEGHLSYNVSCERCLAGEPPFEPKPDVPEWINWKLTDESWAEWRESNPEKVASMKAAIE